MILYALFFLLLPVIFDVFLATEVVILGLFAIAFNLLFGQSGLLSFGHALFLGTGAYIAGLLTIHVGLPIIGILLVVLVVEVLLALIIGLLSLRLSGVYFAMITLAFAQFFYELSFELKALTGGTDGLLGIRRTSLVGLDVIRLQSDIGFYVFASILTFAVLVFGVVLTRSTFGRALRAIRENEERTRALGVDTFRVKVLIFAVSGGIAGLAGALWSLYIQFINPEVLFWTNSGDAVLHTLIGGMETLFGPMAGTLFLVWLESALFENQPGLWNLLLGSIFILFVLFARSGITGVLTEKLRALPDWIEARYGKGTTMTNPEVESE
jgi:branched-chain amino acid transport system permease protein